MRQEIWGSGRQANIYAQAARGGRGAVPVEGIRLEELGYAAMNPAARDYVASGAGGGATLAANRAAFDAWRLAPRMLRDVSRRDLSATVLGTRWAAPVGLAPVGVQGIVHPEGDLPAARAAAARGLPFVLSTVSSRRLEEVAEAMGGGSRWFQLYWGKEPALTASLLARAERAGYTAVVVTLDTPMLGWRERDLERGDLPFLRGEGLANYFSDPVFRGQLAAPPETALQPAVELWLRIFSNPTLTWNDLGWLRQQTRLPLLVKGLQRADDASRALAAGVDGIIVSNHGGRQVEGALGALEALPAIVAAVAGRIPVLFDSGVRRGADAVKALALGAGAVFLGRPFLWGLALAGEAGVGEVLDNFCADFDLTLALCGYTAPGDLDEGALSAPPRG